MKTVTVGIIGLGRLGSALGVALSRIDGGYQIAVAVDIDTFKMNEFKERLNTEISHDFDDLSDCDIVFLTVPDKKIESVAVRVSEKEFIRSGSVICHCSGAFGLDILMPVLNSGARRAALHPLVSIPSGAESSFTFNGAVFGYAADSPCEDIIVDIIKSLRGVPVYIQESNRKLYHAAAVIAGNFPYALMAWSEALMESAGLSEHDAHSAVWMLMKSTLANTKTGLSPQSVSGPLIRGDRETIHRHLTALREKTPEYEKLYKAVSLILLNALKEKTPNHDIKRSFDEMADWLRKIDSR